MRQTVQSTVLEFGSENKCKNQRKTDKTPKPKMSNQADEKNGSLKQTTYFKYSNENKLVLNKSKLLKLNLCTCQD
jgi:hypothetical protein